MGATHTGPKGVDAELTFAVSSDEKPATFPAEPDPETGAARYTGVLQNKRINLNNGRKVLGNLSLDNQGFKFINHQSNMTNFFDESKISEVYYPECIDLVKKFTGVNKVSIFDHTIRIENPTKRNTDTTFRAPVHGVHNDYTDWSAPKRVREILSHDEAEDRLQQRFVMINVWRPLIEPVLSWPLALCDAQSLEANDLIAADHIYPDRRGETYRTAYNVEQNWYYFPEMKMDEVVLIKCFDSETDGRARFSAHGAANLTKSPPRGSKPRESIEVRTIGFYNKIG